MPRPSARKKSEVSKAVAEIRENLEESQQAFAARFGVSVTTVAKYETSNPPTGVALKRFWELADGLGLIKASEVLRDAYANELEERDGLRPTFNFEEPIRDPLGRIIGDAERAFSEKAHSRGEAQAALDKVAHRWENRIRMLHEQLENITVHLGALHDAVKPQDQVNAMSRLEQAKENTRLLRDALNSVSLSGAVRRKPKDSQR